MLGVRVAGWIGAGPADELGPVCAPDDRDLAARALREAIARTRGLWDVLLLDGLPAADGWPSRLSAPRIHRMPSPVIAFPDGGWEAYLATRSSNFRGQVRGRERRLGREHELSFRLADDPGEPWRPPSSRSSACTTCDGRTTRRSDAVAFSASARQRTVPRGGGARRARCSAAHAVNAAGARTSSNASAWATATIPIRLRIRSSGRRRQCAGRHVLMVSDSGLVRAAHRAGAAGRPRCPPAAPRASRDRSRHWPRGPSASCLEIAVAH